MERATDKNEWISISNDRSPPANGSNMKSAINTTYTTSTSNVIYFIDFPHAWKRTDGTDMTFPNEKGFFWSISSSCIIKRWTATWESAEFFPSVSAWEESDASWHHHDYASMPHHRAMSNEQWAPPITPDLLLGSRLLTLIQSQSWPDLRKMITSGLKHQRFSVKMLAVPVFTTHILWKDVGKNGQEKRYNHVTVWKCTLYTMCVQI